MKIASIQACTHAIVMKEMCATCGKDLRERPGIRGSLKEATVANVSMVHHVPELIISDELALKIGTEDRQRLLKAHKLVLLVDLDQTLVHTTNQKYEMEPDTLALKIGTEDRQRLLKAHKLVLLVDLDQTLVHTTNQKYEMEPDTMHVISYGERQYAHRIAEFLDPDKKYFGQRILSRDELFCAMYKTRNMRALFPCGDHMIAMIDDRPDVWQYSDALIQVKPYQFFKDVGDINAPQTAKNDSPGAGNYPETDAETAKDKTLKYVAAVLTKVHRVFYELYDETKVDSLPVRCFWGRKRFYTNFIHPCRAFTVGLDKTKVKILV
ncbi:unnamed protein product [Gongylonema pulchrum]|uniref:protein-serine/threonine phosphatase n=1 Tax=Gongylonema pulchrum TaxID=637853 RepID=A0A183EDF3_9BILA|nr:unnamed protein product [Gongylonema pulchrum]